MRIRTQSADPVIQEAAKQGVRLHCYGGSYHTKSAKDAAASIGCSPSLIREAAAIATVGLGEDVIDGTITHEAAHDYARRILALCAVDDPENPRWKPYRRNTDSATVSQNQHPSIAEDLAEAVAEIRRLRAKLEDLGVDPDE